MEMDEFMKKVNDRLKKGFLVKIKTTNKTYLINKYIAYNYFADLYYGEGDSFTNSEFLGAVNYSDVIGIRSYSQKGSE